MDQKKTATVSSPIKLLLIGCLIGFGIRYYIDPRASSAYNALYASYIGTTAVPATADTNIPAANTSHVLFCPDPSALTRKLNFTAGNHYKISIDDSTWQVSMNSPLTEAPTALRTNDTRIQSTGNLACSYAFGDPTIRTQTMLLIPEQEKQVKPIGLHWIVDESGNYLCTSASPISCGFIPIAS